MSHIVAIVARSLLVNPLHHRCAILALRSIKSSAGIAGKDFQEALKSLARDCDRLSTADLCIGCRPKDGLVRKKTRWLLWLEDTSQDESRRAAAAHRKR
jgi:hypothetical protein